MKYFVDFEATQFTNEIISIGCIREDGKTFSSLVKPTHKVTKFITSLTGITNEMTNNAPSIEEVVQDFTTTFALTSEDSFYVYGNGDESFIKGTLQYTTHYETTAFFAFVLSRLHDFSTDVTYFFGVKSVALKKVLGFIRDENITQTHQALEDAIMLREVFQGLQTMTRPEVNPFPTNQMMPTDINNMVIKATHKHTSKTHFFQSIDGALELLPKPQQMDTKNKMRHRLLAAIKKNKMYCEYKWETIQKQ